MNRLKEYYQEIGMFFIFILLSLVITYPLVLRFTTAIYAYPWPGDPSGTIWHFWWLKYAWVHGLSPYLCPLIAAPFGVNLSVQYPLLNYTVLAFSFLFNEITTYNLLVFISFPLSAFTMYLLVYYITKNRIAGVISGLIFAFCPYHVMRAQGHLTLAHIEWMPLYLLSLFMLSENKNYRNAVFCGLSFALVTLGDFYYGFFMLIITTIFFMFKGFYSLITSERIEINFKTLVFYLVSATVAGVLIISLNLNLFRQNSSSTVQQRVHPLSESINYSARAWAYFVPPITNSLLRQYTEPFIDAHVDDTNICEQTLYLGYIPLFLAAVGIAYTWAKRKSGDITEEKKFLIWFLIFGAFVALIFSGPSFKMVGPIRVYFPSYFLYRFFPMFRCYSRFGIVLMLFIAALAGVGSLCLWKYLREKKTKIIVFSILAAILALEFAFTPLLIPRKPPLPVYTWLAKQKGNFIIAEYPLVKSENVINYDYIFNQRVHRKRLVNGASPYTVAEEWRINLSDISNPKVPSLLSYLKVKYVVLHQNPKRADVGNEPNVSGVGLKRVKSFKNTQVYEVTADPPKQIVIPEKNFHKLEKWADNKKWRWIDDDAKLSVKNLRTSKINANLQFKAVSFLQPRTLKVIVNGNVVGSVKIPSSASSRVFEIKKIGLRPGKNTIVFHCTPGGEVIDNAMHNYDMRKISIAFDWIKILPEDQTN